MLVTVVIDAETPNKPAQRDLDCRRVASRLREAPGVVLVGLVLLFAPSLLYLRNSLSLVQGIQCAMMKEASLSVMRLATRGDIVLARLTETVPLVGPWLPVTVKQDSFLYSHSGMWYLRCALVVD